MNEKRNEKQYILDVNKMKMKTKKNKKKIECYYQNVVAIDWIL